MSGHSKWSKIKRQKGANDAKRGTLFTKLSKAITLAASEGGGDIDMNFSLRLAVEKAKKENMPTDNIDRAIKKGTGESKDGNTISRVTYEGYGPSGSAFIVSTATDNTNRTVAEIRKIFENAGGSLATSGSVMWQFEEYGLVEVEAAKLQKSEKFGQEDTYKDVDIDELEMNIMEIDGILDITRGESNDLEIRTEKTKFNHVYTELEKMKVKILNSDLVFISQEIQSFDSGTTGKVIKLMEALDDHDDVENVFTNINI